MKARGRRPVVAIAGLGLIGGSLAKALVRAGYEVIGIDTPARRRAASTAGALTETAASLTQAAARAALIDAAKARFLAAGAAEWTTSYHAFNEASAGLMRKAGLQVTIIRAEGRL